MIILGGFVHLDPHDIDDFLAEARATYPTAVANPGNKAISLSAHDAAAGTVVVFELWTSQEHLDAHLSNPQVQAIFTKWGSKMSNEVQKYIVQSEGLARG
ncbi:quinol monooxygenase YgiN [Actinoplanes lutulentus]|uniref:Quinol monooxygenase YgiN n=1 Tax=Actinoplanes lutulentus TaxID=1287878 RepID=A0A327Z0P5_9ACTN|nr:antibiotic biosynthesis monooxygenase [Actinoplanes lutulentus]MBB2943407.1 quinol monooxygenase YgiN [Actinoplanes lutulentus]RAK26074.1 quinol monooxygenase YgiN [Actinoplanes lutulentus]